MKLPSEVNVHIKARLLETTDFPDGGARGDYLIEECTADEGDAPVFSIELSAKILKPAKPIELKDAIRATITDAIRQVICNIINEHVERAEMEDVLMRDGSTFTCRDCGGEFTKLEEHQVGGPVIVRELCHKCYARRTAS